MSSCDDLGLFTNPLLDDAYGAVLTIRNREVLDLAEVLMGGKGIIGTFSDLKSTKIGNAQLLLRLLEGDEAEVVLEPIKGELARLRSFRDAEHMPDVAVCYYLFDATLDDLYLRDERPADACDMSHAIERVAPHVWSDFIFKSGGDYTAEKQRWAKVPILSFEQSNLERHGIDPRKLGAHADLDEFLMTWAKSTADAVYADPDLCEETLEEALEQYGIDEPDVTLDEQCI